MSRLENSERIVTATREKFQLAFRGKHIRITSELSTEHKRQERMK
jgi:hypothetical protein